MAARKKSPAAEAAKQVQEAPPERRDPDGFVVVKEEGEDGSLNVAYFPVGDAKLTEAVTLIGMAYEAAKRQAGLS